MVNLLECRDLKVIRDICEKKNIYLFEDNCESMGALVANKMAGSFGKVSSHSFFFSHHMCTMEGGMISTDDFEIYCILKSLRAHGWSRDLPKKNPLFKAKKNDFYEEYKFILPGYNVRPGELHGSIGNIQLKKVNNFIKIRRKIYIFNKLFKNNKKIITKYTNHQVLFSKIVKKIDKAKKLKLFQILKKKILILD